MHVSTLKIIANINKRFAINRVYKEIRKLKHFSTISNLQMNERVEMNSNIDPNDIKPLNDEIETNFIKYLRDNNYIETMMLLNKVVAKNIIIEKTDMIVDEIVNNSFKLTNEISTTLINIVFKQRSPEEAKKLLIHLSESNIAVYSPSFFILIKHFSTKSEWIDVDELLKLQISKGIVFSHTHFHQLFELFITLKTPQSVFLSFIKQAHTFNIYFPQQLYSVLVSTILGSNQIDNFSINILSELNKVNIPTPINCLNRLILFLHNMTQSRYKFNSDIVLDKFSFYYIIKSIISNRDYKYLSEFLDCYKSSDICRNITINFITSKDNISKNFIDHFLALSPPANLLKSQTISLLINSNNLEYLMKTLNWYDFSDYNTVFEVIDYLLENAFISDFKKFLKFIDEKYPKFKESSLYINNQDYYNQILYPKKIHYQNILKWKLTQKDYRSILKSLYLSGNYEIIVNFQKGVPVYVKESIDVNGYTIISLDKLQKPYKQILPNIHLVSLENFQLLLEHFSKSPITCFQILLQTKNTVKENEKAHYYSCFLKKFPELSSRVVENYFKENYPCIEPFVSTLLEIQPSKGEKVDIYRLLSRKPNFKPGAETLNIMLRDSYNYDFFRKWKSENMPYNAETLRILLKSANTDIRKDEILHEIIQNKELINSDILIDIQNTIKDKEKLLDYLKQIFNGK